MNGFLNFTTKLVVYGDPSSLLPANNPRLKFVDWTRNLTTLPVSDPKSEAHTLQPGESKTLYDGTLASTIDNTTTFSLALSSVDATRYRISHTSGTAPGFRVGRNLTLSGVSITFTVNPNQTVTASVPAGPDFTNLLVGDTVFIPHTTTGDTANVISVLNAGFWKVLGKTSNQLVTLVRESDTFEAVTQTVTLTSNSQFRGFSSSGLQPGNFIDISAGFSLSARRSFQVLNVTDLFVEFVSTLPLPSETGIVPTASGFQFYAECKRFVYVEANRNSLLRVNGDTGNHDRLEPVDPSNSDGVAPYFKLGPTWALSIVNQSPDVCSVMFVHCE